MIATVSDRAFLSSIDELIAEMRNGRMIILMDDEGRENEGDLVFPAACATPEAVNFMARFGRGLICLALTKDRVDELGLHLMAQHNRSRHETAFTISIEARDGITTGISAADRARTIQVAIDPACGRDKIVSPGHVFPLVAREGGVLVRAGHTEAAVDLARMAGFAPAGVICEIINDDGTMARLPDIVRFAQFHGLKVGTIAELIEYRRQRERLVRRTAEDWFDSPHGGKFRLIVYTSAIDQTEHVALIKGDLATPGPTLVRMHAMSILRDVFHDRSAGAETELHAAMRLIGEADRGVVVLLREWLPTAVSEQVRRRHNPQAADPVELRHYGIGAQILLDLGVHEMILLTNSRRTIVGLDGYGLSVVEHRPLPTVGA